MKVQHSALNRGRLLIASQQALQRVVAQSSRKTAAVGKRPRLDAVLDELRAMLGLLKAWATGTYQGPSTTNLVLMVGAVVYFLTPIDALPDFILGAGYIDDATVIACVVAKAREELANFKRWQTASDSPDTLPAPNG